MVAVSRGRPRVQETVDDIVASVLATAGAQVAGAKYSTRSIAELTGLSQTLVSRAVRRIRRPGPTPRPTERPALQVSEFRVEFPRITLLFEPAPAGLTPGTRAFERRAAGLMAALWVSGAAAWPASADPVPTASADSPQVQWDSGSTDWETFLSRIADMLDDCAHSPEAIPADLLQALAARTARGLHGLDWRRTEFSGEETHRTFDSQRITVSEFPAPNRSERNRWLPRTELSATEQIAVALRKEMTDSGFSPGDRISASTMAKRLRLGPSTVHTAMRQLADDGLLIRTDRGFRLPMISGTDVIDLYASRLQVGTVILRGCAAAPKHRLLPARIALGSLEAVAARGSRLDSGEADLRFQQELAEASGLPQSARSFHALTLRVRMFISVLQLDYSPAADRLVNDNRRILAAVLEGRAQDAVQVWRSKQDNAVRHMSALAPDTFDASLWDRLSR